MSRFRSRAPSVVAREIAGETFLVPVCGNLADLQRVFVLNRVGGFIWERLDAAAGPAEIAAAVAERFDVDVATATADVARLVAELEAAGLVAERT
jgi:hypothetical protein